ncbi:hypothetical protein KY285_034380 [Solanum tuberosum]|nr:hypothetical protein KY289_032408 [Solanum tuberosum]KAH0649132.1 hypothetical protein KY285_034380 [Solanum tuberosum]
MVGSASGSELGLMDSSSFQFNEPSNALSLHTWASHVSTVVEWVTAMALVWQYGEKSGYESWKGLSWGMVPLLGGALCACTWHFFYNSESLEVTLMVRIPGREMMLICLKPFPYRLPLAFRQRLIYYVGYEFKQTQ